MKYKDIFFIVDLSVNAIRYANEIRGIIKDAVRTIEDITYNKWNIHVNVLTFDGCVFSGKRNVVSRSSVRFYEPPELKTTGHLSLKGNAEGVFRAAFDISISKYKEWQLDGLDATPALIIYISDGSFRYMADRDKENRLSSAFVDEMKSFMKNSGISLKIFALNTRSMEADEKKLIGIAGSRENILHVSSLGNLDKSFFYDNFN